MGKGKGKAKGKGKGKCHWGIFGNDDACPEPVVAADSSDETNKQNQAEVVHHEADEVCFDFTFPVVVEDGRCLTISWNRADDIEQVAACFANEHGIPLDELPTIKGFLEHATNMCEGAQKDSEGEEQKDLKGRKGEENEMGDEEKEKEKEMKNEEEKKDG